MEDGILAKYSRRVTIYMRWSFSRSLDPRSTGSRDLINFENLTCATGSFTTSLSKALSTSWSIYNCLDHPATFLWPFLSLGFFKGLLLWLFHWPSSHKGTVSKCVSCFRESWRPPIQAWVFKKKQKASLIINLIPKIDEFRGWNSRSLKARSTIQVVYKNAHEESESIHKPTVN